MLKLLVGKSKIHPSRFILNFLKMVALSIPKDSFLLSRILVCGSLPRLPATPHWSALNRLNRLRLHINL